MTKEEVELIEQSIKAVIDDAKYHDGNYLQIQQVKEELINLSNKPNPNLQE